MEEMGASVAPTEYLRLSGAWYYIKKAALENIFSRAALLYRSFLRMERGLGLLTQVREVGELTTSTDRVSNQRPFNDRVIEGDRGVSGPDRTF